MSSYPNQRRPARQERLPQVRVNERVKLREARVIDEDGTQLGIMSSQEALEMARAKGLDLVEVAPQAQPPVCRIINYGKWQYEQKKKAHAAKQKQVVITVKEIKFRPTTDDHDYDFKKNNAVRMLQDGDKVKASVRFRGREITHRELGQKLLERLAVDLSSYATVEVQPKLEGMVMFIIFAPKRS